MLSLSEVYKKLKQIYPQAISIANSNGQISQGGVYLSFDELKQDSNKKDIAIFSLIISSRTLIGKTNSILPLLDNLRQKTLQEQNFYFGVEIFSSIRFIELSDSGLYSYALVLQIPFYRDYEDDMEEYK